MNERKLIKNVTNAVMSHCTADVSNVSKVLELLDTPEVKGFWEKRKTSHYLGQVGVAGKLFSPEVQGLPHIALFRDEDAIHPVAVWVQGMGGKRRLRQMWV